jgi:hypothetical protein
MLLRCIVKSNALAVMLELILTPPRQTIMLAASFIVTSAAEPFRPFRDCLLTSGRLMVSSLKNVDSFFLVFANVADAASGQPKGCNSISDTPRDCLMDVTGGLRSILTHWQCLFLFIYQTFIEGSIAFPGPQQQDPLKPIHPRRGIEL